MNHLLSRLDITLAQFSDRGRKAENQDTLGARIPAPEQTALLATKGIALAIADGVSSSAAARQASQAAVSGFLTDYYATPDTWRTQQSAMQVIRSLNQYLWGQSRNSIRDEGYLTTFSALVLKGDKVFSFHVGDSRIYRVRDGLLEQLTRDHTQKIDRNTTYLSRALGADTAVEVDMFSDELQPGDLFILSTDGIHDAVPPAKFSTLARSAEISPQALVDALVAEALAHNSQDNISVQVARIEQTGTPSQDDAVTVLSRLPFPPLLSPGQTLDGLQVDKVLYESERSQVYKVRTSTGQSLVMKTPSVNYSDDPAYIERFVLESWIGSRIHNAHVARVVTPPGSRNALYYLTEFIPGPTLEQLIQQRAPFAIPDAIELIEQIIKGIRAFHRKDTLHQDIKPGNIVIGANGAVIVDFGSCWVAGIHEVRSAFQREIPLGTLSYSAPEYRFGGTIGHRSDQFSLAVLVYEMLTGKLPYGEKYTQANTLKSFTKLRYIPAANHNPLVPHWLDQALEKALSIQPEQRYDALSEWLLDLQRPNTAWLTPSQKPLLQRNPLRVWQLLAAAGWALALAMLFHRR
ncbi:bifunctional protein-serine/threonine kinase/phosphatase [Teredinibacter turnerae]|uniref:Non-specific serine/threonine protein kinase n=1 Tax=Teredinibacter turnerae (strain ATCC 39867 / T7901) TaxID=377629 RepID=C5BND0_TERTT|nr:bifunctional protein-serine/threonine kinase/phosphatase [Teredinibacter turnerae]ACR12519.1 non-specific serine/threonine protein kinase [Teredinibacter turnerae T7901]